MAAALADTLCQALSRCAKRADRERNGLSSSSSITLLISAPPLPWASGLVAGDDERGLRLPVNRWLPVMMWELHQVWIWTGLKVQGLPGIRQDPRYKTRRESVKATGPTGFGAVIRSCQTLSAEEVLSNPSGSLCLPFSIPLPQVPVA